MKIKPTKLVRVHYLCKLMAQNQVIVEEVKPLALLVGLKDTWCLDIAYYLTYDKCLDNLTGKEKRTLRLKLQNL